MQTKRKTSISETINKTQKIITNIHETQSTKNDEQYKQQKKTTTHKTQTQQQNTKRKQTNTHKTQNTHETMWCKDRKNEHETTNTTHKKKHI